MMCLLEALLELIYIETVYMYIVEASRPLQPPPKFRTYGCKKNEKLGVRRNSLIELLQ